MKKGLRRLLSTLLISTLVLTSAGTAFADSSNTMTGADISKAQNPAKAVQTEVSGKIKAGAKTAEGDIPLTMVNATTTSIKDDVVAFDIGDVLPGSTKQGYSKQISLPAKGTVSMVVAAQAYTTSASLEFGLYKDAALTIPVNNYGVVTAKTTVPTKEDTVTRVIQVPSKGTYYLGVQTLSPMRDENQAFLVGAAAGYANGADRTIANGKAIAVGQKDAQTNYFKFKATKTGYLEVRAASGIGSVALCNSKKRAMTDTLSTKYLPTYGVKKGVTYYVKVNSYASSTRGWYNLTVVNKAVSEKSGKSKAKAVTLKKGAKKSGTIIIGDKTADWYKFTLSSKKAVSITIKGATNDNIKADVYDKRGKIGTRSFGYYSGGMTLKSAGKWSKGTFYIKLYRGNSKSSGHYTISWK